MENNITTDNESPQQKHVHKTDKTCTVSEQGKFLQKVILGKKRVK